MTKNRLFSHQLTRTSVLSALAASAVLFATFTPVPAQASVNASTLAASTYSSKICQPKNPAAVAKIPTSVAGFTGYKSAAGNWLALPKTSPLTGKRVALTVMGLGQPFFLAVAGHW